MLHTGLRKFKHALLRGTYVRKFTIFSLFLSDAFEAYCYTEAIYTVDKNETIYLGWYQWVPFVLAVQALLFYLPHFIWKQAEGGKINMMTKDMDEKKTLFEPEGKESKRRANVQYFVRTMNTHNKYVAIFVACEVLNLINVLFQIYFMDFFLNGQFTQYGLDVLRTSELPFEERVDPMAKVKIL